MRALLALVAVVAVLLLGAAPAWAEPGAPLPERDSGLQLDLAGIGPRVVTSDSSSLVVSGRLTNTGTSPVTGIGVRVQRSDPLRTEAAVREALAGDDAADAVTPAFTDLPDLAPGASTPVNLSIPLTGPPTTSLALNRTGVHALLVNVNATRDGVRARMAATRMLLPVLAVPGQPAPPGTPGPAQPATLLFPIVDPPHRLPTVPGEPLTLTDDDLAASFGRGGRLDGLVDALATRAPVGSPLRAGVCVAVDPDLVETAAQMANGYQVRAADGTLTAGAGADAARAWLAKLAGTVRGGCVLALAQSDADLVALARSGASDLAARAVADGRRIAAELLDTPVLADTVWPIDGALDEATLADVGEAQDGSSAVVLSVDSVERSRGGVVSLANGNTSTTAVLTDPLLTLAATGLGDTPASGSPAGGPGALGTQDALGALAFRALTGDPAAGPVALAPPHQWRVDGPGAIALLDGMNRLLTAGVIEPRALGSSIAAGPAPGADQGRLVYPVRAGAEEIPPAVVSSLVAARDDVERLRAAADYETGVGAPPEQVFDPLLRGLLRAASGAWRGDPAAARAQADLVDGRIGELVGSVKVLEPPGPFSLGTRDAPVPLTVANGLPITMTVRVELTSTAGLRVAPIPVQRVPPLGRVQVRVSTEVLRAGQFTVEAAVRTPDGGALGEPTRLQVRSTVYGTVTVWLTAVAGGLLVLLAARRIWRRIRGDRKGSGPDGGTGGTPPAPPPVPPVQADPPNGASAQVRPVVGAAGTSGRGGKFPMARPASSRRGVSSAGGDLP
ncbi:DUF6049 family protein [Pseudonocardia sp. WMMC193]|uniref:DUF6049 family protein n=1 Tax=Pseudonocardia sp. WMMC193 TaxID=2911965 RepID=UPI001F48F45E|nr:DUF6049 family protein [Pseudonocardia sp. WMMC193]MCF7551951.1 DUF6049 family protein [Pseudonocardia sp. WMMC193]